MSPTMVGRGRKFLNFRPSKIVFRSTFVKKMIQIIFLVEQRRKVLNFRPSKTVFRSTFVKKMIQIIFFLKLDLFNVVEKCRPPWLGDEENF